MPLASDLNPNRAERCAGCGEPLGLGPWWCIETQPFHERCAPWESRAFPLSHEIRRLRSLRRKLTRAIAVIDAVGIALRAAERRWPDGALELLAASQKAIEGLDARMRELGWRR
ncbi:hypothetical protein [Sandaracinus amylolyticus]|uniref:Uncharacterized protein n=1 Tax=Sandaracinus amylolyticus TaxID=927083 RepID=A0A0F6YM10_9BACT|nr:hypothetical protein [Sandaracinus amylolyticus]AKF08910.1 hypothetical protein DB32_006059 [Sandaracinus amylolyticus]